MGVVYLTIVRKPSSTEKGRRPIALASRMPGFNPNEDKHANETFKVSGTVAKKSRHVRSLERGLRLLELVNEEGASDRPTQADC